MKKTNVTNDLSNQLKGGVIMDVTSPEQGKIAQAAGACSVMTLERIPADIRVAGGVSRMSDPKMIYGESSHWSFCRSSNIRISSD